ncbi:alpha/beta hydrolase [Magnetospira thiophila]
MSMRFHLVVLALISAIVIGAWEYRADFRRAADALLLVQDLIPDTQQSWLDEATPPPILDVTDYAVDGRARRAEILSPASGGRSGVVLVPGADQAGTTHPAFRALADTLARSGFIVLMPEIPGLRNLELRAADAVPIADAVRHLGERTGRPVGVVAVSYAVGPTLLAVLEPSLTDRVAWVLGVGGYHDSTALITFLSTGFYLGENGRWRHRDPAPYAKWAFLKTNASLMPQAEDRRLLSELADRGGADSATVRTRLSPEGRAVLDLLDNQEPEKVPTLIAALPLTVSKEIEALNLAQRDLSGLKSKLFLVHGRDDPLIPAGQSEALAAAVPQGQADLTLLHSLTHVQFDAISFGDSYRLWRLAYLLLRQRDGLAD